MSGFDAEQSAVNLLTDEQSLARMYGLGLRPNHFEATRNREVFEFSISYWRDSSFQKAPSKEILFNRFPELDLGRSDDSATFIVQELKKRYTIRQIKSSVRNFAQLALKEPMKAVEAFSGDMWRIRQQNRERRNSTDLVDDVEERRRRYALRAQKAEDGVLGESLGFDEIDSVSGGIMPGELAILAAPPKTGKSWHGLQIIRRAMERGRRSIYFTLEMPVGDISDRLESLISGVSYNRYSKGQLSTEELDRLHTAQDHLKEMGSVLITRPKFGERTVESIIAQAKDYEADIIVIDQLSFMEPSRQTNSRWDDVSRMILELKSAISEDPDWQLPVVLIAQFNREGAKAGDRADISQLGMTSELERTSDMILSISQSKDQKANHVLTFQILASRRGEPSRHLLRRELVTGTDYRYIREVQDSEGSDR